MRGRIDTIAPDIAVEFILPRHYSGRKPNVSRAFGLYIDREMVAVCTFGKPASNTLCDGVCGKENSHRVYELNRLCRLEGVEVPMSSFVGGCLRRLKSENWIIVSYADMGMSHHGYVYQASNFKYTGCTKRRLEFHVKGGHSRHGSKHSGFRKVRTPKHRYVFFCVKNRKLRRELESSLRYPILPYPKGDNGDEYPEGYILSPEVVEYPTKRPKS